MGILIIGYEVIVYLLLLICYTVEELNSLEQRTEKILSKVIGILYLIRFRYLQIYIIYG
jgi:hypothetical protein